MRLIISWKAILLLSAMAGAAGLPASTWSKLSESKAISAAIHGTTPGFAAKRLEPNRYELTFAGRRLISRANVESYLLYRAAILARKSRSTWFEFLHLPGEGGPSDHPARADSPLLAAKYRHWQPHWTYYLRNIGWQPWRPEWGTAFWSATVKPQEVDGYEAHAMIELGKGSRSAAHESSFVVADVTRDLAPIAFAIEHNARASPRRR